MKIKISAPFRAICKVKADPAGERRFISALIFYKIPFGEISSGNGEISFFIRSRDEEKIREIAKSIEAEVSFTLTGIPATIQRYRHRIGLPIGAAIAVLMIILSSKFVFDIEITGNKNVTTEKIEAELDSYGFRLGTYIPSSDIDGICKRIAAENEAISWISINMRGTVAHVEVREKKSVEITDTSSPSNIVAMYDGQIVSIEAHGGKSEVKAGQTVKKGEILISGIIDSPALGYRTVRARGRVLARVTRVFSASEELTRTIKTYTGLKTTRKSVKFFSKIINLFKNSNISYEKYDTIETEERLSLFGTRLPLSIITKTYTEYTEDEISISMAEAERAAIEKISKVIGDEAEEMEILYRQQEIERDNEKCTVTVHLECICDISKEQKIGGTPSNE